MANVRHHFDALLTKVNPPDNRVAVASSRVGDLRDWLRNHEFPTRAPHTQLSGSYGRSTATELIADVDILTFIPTSEKERTPNAVLRQLHGVLKDYPTAGAVDLRGQRRSVRVELPGDNLCLDVVPAIAENGLDRPLLVPDRPQALWIASDPLGYAERLTKVNQANGGKLIPLVKLLKVWRDEHMIYRRPKSYVLEVILLYAVEGGELVLCDRSRAENVRDAFVHVAETYSDLMDNGAEAPRTRDPQITGTFITRGWSREHFETFMRRVRETRRAADRAVAAAQDDAATEEWRKVFGTRWPSDDEAKAEARAEARIHQPGVSKITSAGGVVGGSPLIATRPTRYHGA